MAWELGHRVPSAPQLPRLASALSVDVSSLTAALPTRVTTSTLGELIVQRQRDLGLRSVDIAQSLGSSEATISRWINGHSQPAARNLRRLAVVLKVPHERVFVAAGAVA
jgi:transcriptional regulator with XRE-family HTH domain